MLGTGCITSSEHAARNEPNLQPRTLETHFKSAHHLALRKERRLRTLAQLRGRRNFRVNALQHIRPGHHYAVNWNVAINVQISQLDVVGVVVSPRIVLPRVIEQIPFD